MKSLEKRREDVEGRRIQPLMDVEEGAREDEGGP